jgi:hypothetical protein
LCCYSLAGEPSVNKTGVGDGFKFCLVTKPVISG